MLKIKAIDIIKENTEVDSDKVTSLPSVTHDGRHSSSWRKSPSDTNFVEDHYIWVCQL